VSVPTPAFSFCTPDRSTAPYPGSPVPFVPVAVLNFLVEFQGETAGRSAGLRRVAWGSAAVVVAVVTSVALAACGSSKKSSSSSSSSSKSSSSSSGSGAINGAGSTLAAPIYQQWGMTLKSQGLTANYNPVGSGAGQTQLEAATIDFAGSDPALKSSDKAKMKGPVLQFPVAFGAITVSYNLSGVKSGLKLDGTTIANITISLSGPGQNTVAASWAST